MDTNAVTLTPIDQLKLDASTIMSKAKIEKAQAAGFGALGAMGKMLMVFKAMMGGNALLQKEGKAMQRFDMLRGIVYNTVKDCSSLKELQQYFAAMGQTNGTNYKPIPGLYGETEHTRVTDNMFAKTPGYAAFVDQLGQLIQSKIDHAPHKDTKAYEGAEENVFMGIVKADSTHASRTDHDLKMQEKDLESEQTSMNNAMKSITSMGPSGPVS